MTIEKVKFIKRASNFIERTRKELGELIPMWLVLVIAVGNLLCRLTDDLSYDEQTFDVIMSSASIDSYDISAVIIQLVSSVIFVTYLKRGKSTSIMSIILVVILVIFFLDLCKLI